MLGRRLVEVLTRAEKKEETKPHESVECLVGWSGTGEGGNSSCLQEEWNRKRALALADGARVFVLPTLDQPLETEI